MQSVLDAASDDGFVLMEGACGTGKTLTALSPYISMVRNNSTRFKRIVVVTSVKQQQRAFEDEVRDINTELTRNGRQPLSALTLVGKADMCPYVQEGAIGDKEIYTECDRLRENTAKLIDGDKSLGDSVSSTTGDALVGEADANHNPDYDEDDEGPYYVFDNNIPVEADTDTDYCPYYAQHLQSLSDDASAERNPTDPASDTIPFDLAQEGLVTPQRLLTLAGEAGTCPHSVMGEALGRVEVVIANYYHLFEPTTVSTFTKELISDETLLVVDEAHNLPTRVQSLLDRQRSLSSFDSATEEVAELLTLFEYPKEQLVRIRDAMATHGSLGASTLSDELRAVYEEIQDQTEQADSLGDSVEEFVELGLTARSELHRPVEQLEAWQTFIREFADTVDASVSDRLEQFSRDNEQPPYEFEIPLREPRVDPNAPSSEWQDDLSTWMEFQSDTHDAIAEVGEVGQAIVNVQSTLHEEVLEYDDLPSFSAGTVGGFIDMWQEFDESQYFRLIEMERRMSDRTGFEYDWQDEYTATLTLHNCIPRGEIADRLAEFGAGVLMSATLVPLHVTREMTGLDQLKQQGRTVNEEQYGLIFPERNRMSFSVDAPSFKYNNKKQPFDRRDNPNTNNSVRELYAQAIFNVVETTPGNVLITMPSYKEAEWAGELLRQTPSLDPSQVLIDASSTNYETEQMKQTFFDSDEAVLLTGAHGTLTEGIDYAGERLGAVVCCGVPLENTNNIYAKASRTAYEAEFGKSNGFEYAFTVPAVHKTRQALGRVIRTAEDVGVRVLVDERYTGADDWDNVRHLLSPNERREFQDVQPDDLFTQLEAFWEYHGLDE
jgi:DNA excision repair protein ERCC-2